MSTQLLTIPEVAARLGVKAPNTVYRLIAAGKLRAVDVAVDGGKSKTRIRDDDLQAYIEAITRETRAS